MSIISKGRGMDITSEETSNIGGRGFSKIKANQEQRKALAYKELIYG
jgi:hypothetical protein